MPGIRYPEQRNELQDLLRRAHLDYAQLHERVPQLSVQTLEKYCEGWQQAGKNAKTSIRLACELEIHRLEAAASKGHPASGQHDEVVKYAGKLLELPEKKRELAKRLIDELGEDAEPVSQEEAERITGSARAKMQKHLPTNHEHPKGERG